MPKPQPTSGSTPPTDVLLHRLRQSYCTLEEKNNDFQGRQCEHCSHLTRHPLQHYLLSCLTTARLRHYHQGPRDRETRAALVLRRTQEHLPQLLQVARDVSAPR